jgi:hypothetical protein
MVVYCCSLKGKLFHATKENTELKQEVAYLTSCLQRTVVSKKMIEDDMNRVEESVSYPIFMPKPSTHRMHYPGSNVPHIRPKGFTENQMS